jgi:arylsulfatase A-like enzyme
MFESHMLQIAQSSEIFSNVPFPELRTVTAPVSALDWLLTLSKLAGGTVDPANKWEGVDVWPLLAGRVSSPPERVLYWKTKRATAVRDGDWKLIVPIEPEKQASEPSLFNLADDTYETTDLAQKQPQRVAHLRKVLSNEQASDP